jgi:hypothetical protein
VFGLASVVWRFDDGGQKATLFSTITLFAEYAHVI